MTFLQQDSRARSAAKAVSWRILGSADTLALSYVLTGSMSIAGSIAGVETLTKSILYYLHERAWGLIKRQANAKSAVTTAGSTTYSLRPEGERRGGVVQSRP